MNNACVTDGDARSFFSPPLARSYKNGKFIAHVSQYSDSGGSKRSDCTARCPGLKGFPRRIIRWVWRMITCTSCHPFKRVSPQSFRMIIFYSRYVFGFSLNAKGGGLKKLLGFIFIFSASFGLLSCTPQPNASNDPYRSRQKDVESQKKKTDNGDYTNFGFERYFFFNNRLGFFVNFKFTLFKIYIFIKCIIEWYYLVVNNLLIA